jgi:hypothetical protein
MALYEYLPGYQTAHFLVACMPKSGSTFLTEALASLPGFKRAVLVPQHGRREQELERRQLQKYWFAKYATQHQFDTVRLLLGPSGDSI